MHSGFLSYIIFMPSKMNAFIYDYSIKIRSTRKASTHTPEEILANCIYCGIIMRDTGDIFGLVYSMPTVRMLDQLLLTYTLGVCGIRAFASHIYFGRLRN